MCLIKQHTIKIYGGKTISTYRLWNYQIRRYTVRYLPCYPLNDLNLITGCGTAQCWGAFKLKKKIKCFRHWTIQVQKGFVPLNDNVHVSIQVIIHWSFNPLTIIRLCFVVISMYFSPNIVRVIKPRRMRWAGHVARMVRRAGRVGSWWGNRRERDHWGDLSVDGRIILGWISRRWDVDIWTGLGWPRIGTGGGRLWVR